MLLVQENIGQNYRDGPEKCDRNHLIWFNHYIKRPGKRRIFNQRDIILLGDFANAQGQSLRDVQDDIDAFYGFDPIGGGKSVDKPTCSIPATETACSM